MERGDQAGDLFDGFISDRCHSVFSVLSFSIVRPTSLRVTLIAVLVRPEQPSVWVTLDGPASHLTRLEDRNDFPHLQCHRFWKEKMADLSGYFERLL